MVGLWMMKRWAAHLFAAVYIASAVVHLLIAPVGLLNVVATLLVAGLVVIVLMYYGKMT